MGTAVPIIRADGDERLHVLEGKFLVPVDGTDHPVGPSGVVVFPRGVPHAFLVTSETARLLTLLVPGSAEAFYRAASEPASADADPSGPVDFAKVREAAERSGGMKLVGPPPFKPAQAGSWALGSEALTVERSPWGLRRDDVRGRV